MKIINNNNNKYNFNDIHITTNVQKLHLNDLSHDDQRPIIGYILQV